MGGKTCIFCGKYFKYTHCYHNHLFTHTLEKPFTCTECDTEFSSSYSRDRHLNDVHLGIKDACDNCGQLFNSAAFYRHRRTGCPGPPKGGDQEAEKRPAFVPSQQTNVPKLPKEARVSLVKLEDTPKGKKYKGILADILKTPRRDEGGDCEVVEVFVAQVNGVQQNGNENGKRQSGRQGRVSVSVTPRRESPRRSPVRKSAYSPNKLMSLMQGLSRVSGKKEEDKPEPDTRLQEKITIKTEEQGNGEVAESSVKVPEVKKEEIDEPDIIIEVVTQATGEQRTNDVSVEKPVVNARVERVSVIVESKPDPKEPVPNSTNSVPIIPETREEDDVKIIVEEKIDEDIVILSPSSRTEEEAKIKTSVSQPSSLEKLPSVETEETVKHIPATVPSTSSNTPTVTVTAASPPPPPSANLPTPANALMPPPPVPPALRTPSQVAFRHAGPPPPRPQTPPQPQPKQPVAVHVYRPNLPTFLPPVPPNLSVDVITWNPVTGDRGSLTSPTGEPLITNDLVDARRPPHPNNLYFTVNGQVDMPLFSIQHLRYLARKRGISTNSSSSSSEDEDEPSYEMQQRTRVYTTRPSSTSSAGNRVRGHHLMNEDRPFECSICGSRFKGACHLATHMKTHKLAAQGDCTFGCYFCASSYNSNGSVVCHIVIQHSKRGDPTSSQYYCPFCERAGINKVFRDRNLFMQHVRAHTVQEGRHSPVRTFASPASTPPPRQTVSRSHPSKPKPRKALRNGDGVTKHKCSYCIFTCRDRTKLQAHERTHTGIRPFPCRFCHQKFNQKANLVYHCINVHCRVSKYRASNPQFACKIKCGVHVIVNTKQEMYHHIVSHHDDLIRFKKSQRVLTDSDRPFHCPLCSKKYPVKFTLVKHFMGTHCIPANQGSDNGEVRQAITCGLCQGEFEDKDKLHRHLVFDHRDTLRSVTEEAGTRGQKLKHPKKMAIVHEDSAATESKDEVLLQEESSKMEVEVEPTENVKTPAKEEPEITKIEVEDAKEEGVAEDEVVSLKEERNQNIE